MVNIMCKQSLLQKLLVMLALLITISMGSCSSLSGEKQPEPSSNPIVPGPQSGRDMALNYVRDHYGLRLKSGSENWIARNITPEGITTSEVYEFVQNEWVVSVVYRTVEPNQRIYKISITNHVSFIWEGQVDAFGQVTELQVNDHLGEEALIINPTQIAEPTQLDALTPTPTQALEAKIYTDEAYRLGFAYPNSWSLASYPAGRNVGDEFGAKTIELTRDGVKFSIQYKFLWERTVIGETLPDGNIEIRRRVAVLGLEIPVISVVVDGYDKYIFLDGSKDDLEFGFYISTDQNEIPINIQNEVDLILASVIRTGEPFPTPTISPTPKPTSAVDATRSGSGSGSTVSEDCNKANFVSHVTVPEGTLLLPGVKFTKIWRIQNVGICTWTTAYSLVFSTGDLMGADKRVNLPESVPPGDTVDIAVDFTSPEKVGHYQGYWILNDPQGYWFGLGELKDGFIPIDIVVFLPTSEYAYDLAIHYCDATWTSKALDENKELPCPGSPTSTQGYVILVADPNLENRHENELALWVHPNEERYGWIRGIYPSYAIKDGDHFRSWISCLSEMNLCSLKFTLSYKDENGDIHELGNWIETYDGKIKEIDIDLSSLAGQSVRFILRTEALTHNVSAAQGYWFVPRVENP